MGWLNRFLKGRRELLNTAEPERAFAPEPAADTWQLTTGSTNDAVLAAIVRNGLSLVAVATGEVCSLSAFAG